MANQRHIPLELQHAILEELRDSENMAQVLPCRLVSTDFHDIVTPFALKTIYISSKHLLPAQRTNCDSNAENAFIRDLPESSPVFKHVKEIVMDLCHLIDFCQIHEVKDDNYNEIASMLTQLARFPSLDTLRLHFIEKPVTWRLESGKFELDVWSIGTFQLSMFETLSKIASQKPFNLLKLDIRGLVSRREERLPLEGIHPLLTNLDTLQLYILTDCCEGFDAFEDVHAEFFQSKIFRLLSSTRNLTDLSLHLDTGMYMFTDEQWRSLHFPSLKRLHLNNIVFEIYSAWFSSTGNYPAEKFILRHGDTLETLNLSHSCLARDARPGLRTWAVIWAGFERRFPNLRQFEFDPLPGFAEERWGDDSDLVEGYCRLLSGRNSGYYSTSFKDYEELPFDIDEDKLMFRSLQETIQARNDSYLNK